MWGTGGSSTCDLHAPWPILGAWFPGLRAPQLQVLSHLTPGPSSMSAIAGRRPHPRAEHQTQWTNTPPHPSNCLRRPGHSLNTGAPLGTKDWAVLGPCRRLEMWAAEQMSAPWSEAPPEGLPQTSPQGGHRAYTHAPGQKTSHMMSHGPQGPVFIEIQPGAGTMDPSPAISKGRQVARQRHRRDHQMEEGATPPRGWAAADRKGQL